MRDYGGASRVTVAGRMLLEQVARLKLQAERERDPLITATLSNSIARLLAKVETYPETSRVIHGTPWWQTAKADAT